MRTPPNSVSTRPSFNDFDTSPEAIAASRYLDRLDKELSTPPEPKHDAFACSAYRKEHNDIRKAIGHQKLSSRQQACFTLTWLSHKYRVPFDDLVADVVRTYNSMGHEFTALWFRFGRNHPFDWLPFSGEVETLNCMLYKGRIVRVPDEFYHRFKRCLLERRLKMLPPDLKPIALARPPRRTREIRHRFLPTESAD